MVQMGSTLAKAADGRKIHHTETLLAIVCVWVFGKLLITIVMHCVLLVRCATAAQLQRNCATVAYT